MLPARNSAEASADLEIADYAQFFKGYLHHTRVPAVLVAAMPADRVAARVKFSGLRFDRLVTDRFRMDAPEASSVAEMLGANVRPPFHLEREMYAAIVQTAVSRSRLHEFFEDHVDSGDSLDRIRPRGYNVSNHHSADTDFGTTAKQWRSRFRSLPTAKRMLLASILWLYSGTTRNLWLHGVRTNWSAVDAFEVLEAAGLLNDWAEVFAGYAGWLVGCKKEWATV